jgi:DegV family protein with EDD domain
VPIGGVVTVRVVTDSTSDLPKQAAVDAGLVVEPLNVHFGGEVFRDGVDITAEAFYKRLVTANPLPTTSQPSVGAFLETYERLAREGATGIVSVHISAKLSGTYNSAIQAKAEFKGRIPIEVVDTEQASLGLAFTAMAAAKAAKGGASARQVAEVVKAAAKRAHFFGTVDTLDYLVKGGRIGKAQAFLGGVLKIKPVISIHEGVAHPVERCRTLAKALDRMVEIAREAAPLESIGVLHSTTPDVAQTLAERVKELSPDGKVLIAQFGPVVGTYLGPGALGIGLLSRGR